MVFPPNTSNPLFSFPHEYALNDCLMQRSEAAEISRKTIKIAARHFANSQHLIGGVESGARRALNNQVYKASCNLSGAQQKLVQALIQCAKSSKRAQH